jgi:ParB family protein of integrating conjugative element (PFGI_1 class)
MSEPTSQVSGQDRKRTPQLPPHGKDGEMLLHLPLDHIKPYGRNPRRSPHPQYARLKASIRADGMGQPLVVTQCPGEADYTVGAGGNTRLQILQELYEETSEDRFSEALCVCRPWSGEAAVLLAHLKENDLRGDLTFLDKALAVQEARALLEEELGGGSLTQTRLAELLKERGYGLSQGLISQMAYAVERLLPLLPNALRGGLGRPQVERLRQLEKAARSLWLERAIDTEDELETTLTALCQRYDGPELDFDGLRRALEAEIAERAEISLHAAHLDLQSRLGRGEPEDAIRHEESPTIGRPDAPPSQGAPSRAPVSTESSAPEPTVAKPKASEPRSPEKGEPALEEPPEGVAEGSPSANNRQIAAPVVSTEPSNPEPLPTESTAPMDLKSLRARAWTLASRLAQRNGLGELIQPLAGEGLGFVLTDVPDPALVDQLDEDALAQVSMVWWQLAAACELTVAPVARLLPQLTEGSVLHRALEDQDAGLLFSSVWTLDPGHTGFRLWRRLDEPAWRDLLALMETYRALHRLSESSRQPLWP